MRRWMLTVLVAGLSLLLGGCAYVNLELFPEKGPLKERVVEGKGERKILLVDVTGIISEDKRRSGGFREETSMVDEIRESLRKAREDSRIAALIVRINSPGGTVTASDILRHEIIE